jgi:hypothetical protein
MPAPTYVAHYASAWNTTTSPKTCSVTVAAGDTLVVYAITSDAAATVGTPTGGGLTYTAQQTIAVSSYAWLSIWTASAGSAQTFTLTATRSGSAFNFGIGVHRYSNVASIGASAKTNASGAPSLSLTTTAANSAISGASGDWNPVDGAARTWRTANVAATETDYAYVSGQYTIYAAVWTDAGAAGAKTVGLSAPTGQKYSIAAVELVGAAGGASFTGTGSAALTLGASATGGPTHAATAAVSLAGTGTGSPRVVGQSSTTLTLASTRTGSPRVVGQGSAPLTPMMATEVDTETLIGTGTLALTLAAASATLPRYATRPPAGTTGGLMSRARISAPFRLLLADTVTGGVVAELPIATPPTWQRVINGAGSLSATVMLQPRIDDDTLQMLREPWRWTLVYSYGTAILQAGILNGIVVDDTQHPATAQLTTVTMWDYMGKKALALYERQPVDITATTSDIVFGAASPDVGNQGLSWGSVAVRLVQIWQYYAAGPYSPPLLLPDTATGTAEITYSAADLATIGTRLGELTQRADPVEIEFSPEWADSRQTVIRWRMRVADGRLGQLGYPWAFDYGQACTSIKTTIDGGDQAFEVFTKGQDQRSTEGGALAWAHGSDLTYPDAGWPWLQVADTTHSSEPSSAVLQSYVDGALATHATPRVSGSASVRMDGRSITGQSTGSPPVEAIQVGDTATIHVDGHPYLAAGEYGVRLVGITNGADQWSATGDVQLLGMVAT